MKRDERQKSNARRLRNEQTPSETILWYQLAQTSPPHPSTPLADLSPARGARGEKHVASQKLKRSERQEGGERLLTSLPFTGERSNRSVATIRVRGFFFSCANCPLTRRPAAPLADLSPARVERGKRHGASPELKELGKQEGRVRLLTSLPFTGERSNRSVATIRVRGSLRPHSDGRDPEFHESEDCGHSSQADVPYQFHVLEHRILLFRQSFLVYHFHTSWRVNQCRKRRITV